MNLLTDNIESEKRIAIEDSIKKLLLLIGEDVTRNGLKETPSRVAKMYEEVFSGYREDPKKVLDVTFDENYNELVVIRDIDYYSHCEHHMIPFFGKVHIGYYPNKKIAGLSKFARLVEVFSNRLQVQERLTSQIAEIIEEVLCTKGVIVIVEGKHLCMCSRGVKQVNSNTVTIETRGVFKGNDSLRFEFLTLVKD
ncbi:MAG: GTP cyclohydrolase I FolE [Psychrobacillus sp.]